MKRYIRGFSLIELLVALLIVLSAGMMTFQLFRENERVIRDQNLIMEMQQTARVVISQIADELRMAGQTVPVFATRFDTSPSEATAIFLGTSTSDRIDFRAGLSNVATVVTTPAPIDLSVGLSQNLAIADSSGLAAGKFVYIWGPCPNSWGWARAQLMSVTSTTIVITTQQVGGIATTIHFTAAPTVFLEEAVSIYLSAGSVRRASSNDFSNPANPTWNPSNEIGRNVTALTLTYYDAAGNAILPISLANRTTISRVDIRLTVQSAGTLANGRIATYSLALRTIPRNVRIRSAD
jgi:prepilin-type N-terminal cleavage/methylation domain-containing protein